MIIANSWVENALANQQQLFGEGIQATDDTVHRRSFQTVGSTALYELKRVNCLLFLTIGRSLINHSAIFARL